MTEIYTLNNNKPGYKLPSRNKAIRLTEMRNELIMGEDKMRAWQVFDQAFNFI